MQRWPTQYAEFDHAADCYARPKYRGATYVPCLGYGAPLDDLRPDKRPRHWRRLYCCVNCRVRANRNRHAAED